MHKQEFLAQLRTELSGLPQDDISERMTFYSEMIDDQIEEGLSEEEAVAAIGSAPEIAAQIIAETPLVKIAKERIQVKRQLATWEIVLLVLGFPIWFSIGIAAVAVCFSLYVSLWFSIISLWAVFGALTGCFIGVLATGIVLTCCGNVLPGIALFGAGLVCAGLSVFVFCGCRAATKGILMLTKKIAVWIMNCSIKKEEV